MNFNIHRFELVDSTNRLAASGKPGDVFVAAEQSAGRGRLDHKWHSRPGENLLMSAVLDVSGISPAEVATFPLVAGLAVIDAIKSLFTFHFSFLINLKWPNDVYIEGRKVCGILCERHGDNIVVGIGINVRQREFPSGLRTEPTSLALCGLDITVEEVLTAVLASLDSLYTTWRAGGFAAVHPKFDSVDFLKGREVSVMLTDEDREPVRGLCGGITPDGSLLVGTDRIYAGEVQWH